MSGRYQKFYKNTKLSVEQTCTPGHSRGGFRRLGGLIIPKLTGHACREPYVPIRQTQQFVPITGCISELVRYNKHNFLSVDFKRYS